MRRSAAVALGELDDARGYDPLVAALKDSHPVVCWKAAEALEKLKDPRAIELSIELVPRPKPIKTIPKIDSGYISDCFDIQWPEFDDRRTWDEVPEGSQIKRLRDSKFTRDLEEALEVATRLTERMADWHGSYDVAASILGRLGLTDKAREMVLKGLDQSKSKWRLCGRMAIIEWESNDILDHLLSSAIAAAVQWWIRSIVIQVSIDRCEDYTPALYLSYVAISLGLEFESRLLELMSKKSGGDGIVLSRENIQRVHERIVVNESEYGPHYGGRQLKRTIQVLCQYLEPGFRV